MIGDITQLIFYYLAFCIGIHALLLWPLFYVGGNWERPNEETQMEEK